MLTQDLYAVYTRHRLICTDTRKVSPGCLFFALKGERYNGNEFVKQALQAGAAFAVTDSEHNREIPGCIMVPDALQALQNLARYHREQLRIPVIGITGTNGKTTTKELVNSVLSQRYKTHATQGNLNNHIGVPLTLLAIGSDIEIAVIEMGANHVGEIEHLCSIAQPTHGIITNIGKAHLEGFGGVEGVKKAKGELYSFLKTSGGISFVPADCEVLSGMALHYGLKDCVYYGSTPASFAGIRIIENNPFLGIEWTHLNQKHRVNMQLTGTYNRDNILAAVAFGLFFNLSADEINTGLSTYVPGNNRSQVMKTERNIVIGDYYNANPSSMMVALENLEALSAGKKAVILGDMFELGQEAEAEHSKVVQKAMELHAHRCIFIGAAFFAMKTGGAEFYATVDLAIEGLKAMPLAGATVLIKGSRGMKLEELIAFL